MSRYIIRPIVLTHCKRGPKVCAECRAMEAQGERWSLLDTSPPHPGREQRRVIEVEEDGERTWREFDVVRVFDSEAEARAFFSEHEAVLTAPAECELPDEHSLELRDPE
jgi:hypothetical protein